MNPHLEEDARRFLDGATLREYLVLLNAGFSGCERLTSDGLRYDPMQAALVKPDPRMLRAIEIRAQIGTVRDAEIAKDLEAAFKAAVKEYIPKQPGRKGGETDLKRGAWEIAEMIPGDESRRPPKGHGRQTAQAMLDIAVIGGGYGKSADGDERRIRAFGPRIARGPPRYSISGPRTAARYSRLARTCP